jgi:hypothetical protein
MEPVDDLAARSQPPPSPGRREPVIKLPMRYRTCLNSHKESSVTTISACERQATPHRHCRVRRPDGQTQATPENHRSRRRHSGVRVGSDHGRWSVHRHTAIGDRLAWGRFCTAGARHHDQTREIGRAHTEYGGHCGSDRAASDAEALSCASARGVLPASGEAPTGEFEEARSAAHRNSLHRVRAAVI